MTIRNWGFERVDAAPDPALRPSARRAVVVMYVGLALTVAAAVEAIVEQATGALSQHLHYVYAGYAVSVPPGSSLLAYLLGLGALGTVGWLWMAWAVQRRRRWAPAVATVLFVLATGLAVANLTIREYGQTILPTNLGLVGLLPCVAGLVAVVLLWRRE